MTGPEQNVQRAIVRALRARGAYVRKMHGGAGSAGMPDLIAALPPQGTFVGIEVKAPGRESTVTALQARTLRALADRGARTGVASSVDDALAIAYGSVEDAPPPARPASDAPRTLDA